MSLPTRGEEIPSSRPRHGIAQGAELVLLNGKIWTGEPASPPGAKAVPAKFAQAVAMASGRILAVGSNAEVQAYAGRNTQVVNLKGRLAVPGLIDSHAHFIQGGFQLLQIDLKDAGSEAEFSRRIAQRASTMAPGRWLLGGDWDEQAWAPAKLPTRGMIDAGTESHPVFLSRYDGHAGLANSLALKLAGVTRATPDPVGGVIVRDAMGEPTGIFKDAAQDLIAKAIPSPAKTDMTEALRLALQEAARVGLTSVHSITVDADSWNGSFTGEIQLLRQAEWEGWLTCRIYEVIPITHWEKLRDAGLAHNMGDDFIKLGGVKAFADGSLGSATAWMDEPFADNPANHGIPLPLMNPPAKMEALASGADGAQIQLCIHAIGDHAIGEILIYARLGGGKPAAHRFRIDTPSTRAHRTLPASARWESSPACSRFTLSTMAAGRRNAWGTSARAGVTRGARCLMPERRWPLAPTGRWPPSAPFWAFTQPSPARRWTANTRMGGSPSSNSPWKKLCAPTHRVPPTPPSRKAKKGASLRETR